MCERHIISETKDLFARPKLKKPTPTRNRRYEQFLWKELYDEYIRHNEIVPVPDKLTTEYVEKFFKDMPPEDAAAKEAVINRYPLYYSTAITVWNNNGDGTLDFKKRYSMTRPQSECTEQFG